MYYICKFSGTWSLYDGIKNTSRLLEAQEVDCLKNLFSGLVDSSKIMEALQITTISPNKLQQLTAGKKESPAPKKLPESAVKN
jgi:hypothetical protein